MYFTGAYILLSLLCTWGYNMIHTNRLDYTINSMQRRPYWKAESCSASEEPCYVNRTFTIGVTKVRHWFLFWARNPNLKTAYPIHRDPYRFSDLFSYFPHINNECHVTCPSHSLFLEFSSLQMIRLQNNMVQFSLSFLSLRSNFFLPIFLTDTPII